MKFPEKEYLEKTYEIFQIIMDRERRLAGKDWYWTYLDPKRIYCAAMQVIESGRNALVLRGYNSRYGLTPLDADSDRGPETVGAHVSLFMAIVDQFFDYCLPSKILPNLYGYNRSFYYKAILRHDLPENDFGDEPDNDSSDRKKKRQREWRYQEDFSRFAEVTHRQADAKVRRLLEEMEECSSKAGRMLYCADKVSASVITLCCDLEQMSPRMKMDAMHASERDRREMALCDDQKNKSCKASEMWIIDYLHERKLTQYDDRGFFTALLVMITLIINGSWYKWPWRTDE